MATDATIELRNHLMEMVTFEVEEDWRPCVFVPPFEGLAMAKVWKVFFD